jgi:hypothetical protein
VIWLDRPRSPPFKLIDLAASFPFSKLLYAADKYYVSRQLQAVDCDEDGGIVMREIAVGLCAAGGCCPYYLGIPT